jgi:hypothetical protein
VLDDDPNAANFRVKNMALDGSLTPARFQERLALLNHMSAAAQPITSPQTAQIDIFNEQASTMLNTGDAANAFDLSKEPDKVRERYGRHSWGQSHLLARRLIESGTRFVTTVNGPSITWDTHKDNFNGLKNRLVPPMEQAYAALLDDLEERGLLESTLVVWMGEFGRTPKINADAGRDHWPGCYSVLMAGGGVRGGGVRVRRGARDAVTARAFGAGRDGVRRPLTAKPTRLRRANPTEPCFPIVCREGTAGSQTRWADLRASNRGGRVSPEPTGGSEGRE